MTYACCDGPPHLCTLRCLRGFLQCQSALASPNCWDDLCRSSQSPRSIEVRRSTRHHHCQPILEGRFRDSRVFTFGAFDPVHRVWKPSSGEVYDPTIRGVGASHLQSPRPNSSERSWTVHSNSRHRFRRKRSESPLYARIDPSARAGSPKPPSPSDPLPAPLRRLLVLLPQGSREQRLGAQKLKSTKNNRSSSGYQNEQQRPPPRRQQQQQ